MKDLYDVLIIGGGVIGSAIARELSRYELSIAVLEKNPDICNETSGRNTGVVHGGFAYDNGSLKARFCVQGNRIMDELADELGFTFKRCGKVLVGNTKEEYASLERTMAQGQRNGVEGLVMVDDVKLHELVPAVIGAFALYSPNSGIIDPFEYTIALAENAVENGVPYYLSHEVTSIERDGGTYEVTAQGKTFYTRWIVNAAGLGCKQISDMLGITGYHVIGSKDDYIILDSNLGHLVPMPIYTVPSNTYMGVHVSCTTDGTVLIGPTAEVTDNLSYYGVEQRNIDALAKEGEMLWPHFTRADYIRTYTGILPKLVDDNGMIQDFKIEIRDELAPHAVNLIGIESPGLTSSVPIARYVISLMQEREAFEPKAVFNTRRAKPVRFSLCSAEQQAHLIEENPDYGQVICRCNKVTKAEVLQAIHNPLGASTMTAIKYRTKCMMGRCQGGYCQMRIAKLLEDELGVGCTELLYQRKGSNMFYGRIREEAR